MNKKLVFVLLMVSLLGAKANATNNNPASVDYVKQYVASQIASLPAGPAGAIGPAGPAGPTGATGPAGTSLDFADFFALMPPDNAATVAPGTDVSFPQDGPAKVGGAITRTGPSSFNLSNIGTYQVMFQVSVTEGGSANSYTQWR